MFPALAEGSGYFWLQIWILWATLYIQPAGKVGGVKNSVKIMWNYVFDVFCKNVSLRKLDFISWVEDLMGGKRLRYYLGGRQLKNSVWREKNKHVYVYNIYIYIYGNLYKNIFQTTNLGFYHVVSYVLVLSCVFLYCQPFSPIRKLQKACRQRFCANIVSNGLHGTELWPNNVFMLYCVVVCCCLLYWYSPVF